MPRNCVSGTSTKAVSLPSRKKYGAFVSILPGRDALCHISELDIGFVEEVANICKPGDMISVMVIGFDERGRAKLSRKAALRVPTRQSIKQPKTISETIMCIQLVMLRVLTVI